MQSKPSPVITKLIPDPHSEANTVESPEGKTRKLPLSLSPLKDQEEYKEFSRYAFYIFGIGVLLPWNTLLAAMDFFQIIFPKESGYKPSFAFLVAVSVPMLVFELAGLMFLQKVNLHLRMTLTFAINTLATFSLMMIPYLFYEIGA
jgi:hypothetical protein